MDARTILNAARDSRILRNAGVSPVGASVFPIASAFAKLERRAFAAKGKTAKRNHHGKRK